MRSSNGILSNEVLVWRLIGAAIWALLGLGCAAHVWDFLAWPALILSPWVALGRAFSLAAWWRVIKLAAAEALVFAAHAVAATTAEPAPGYGWRLLGASSSTAALLVSKAVGRARSAAGLLGCAAYAAAHAASALLLVLLDSRTRSALAGSRLPLVLSLSLALVHGAYILYWSKDVVVFPAVQRHRYFRLKRRLPGVAGAALRNAALAVGLALGADLALNRGALSVGAEGVAAAALAAALCSLCWLWGVEVLDVVLSERLRPNDYPSKDVLGAMLASLDGKQGVLMRDLALQDFSCLAYERGGAAGAWRRLDVFADDSGERWRPLAAFCIGEVEGLAVSLAEALPQSQPRRDGAGAAGPGGGAAGPKAGAAGGTRAAKKWNALPLAAKGALSVSRGQLQALAAARCRYQRTALSVRTLAGFAEASLREDKYGVLQLTQPGLAELLLCLLGALSAVQHFARLLTTLAPRHLCMGPWRGQGEVPAPVAPGARQPIDAAVLALQDTLTTSLYALANAFGDGLAKVLKESKGEPAFGGRAEAEALLQSILNGQE